MRLGAAALLGLVLTTTAACGGGEEEPSASPADVEVCEIAFRVLELYDRAMTDDAVRMGRVYRGARNDLAALEDEVTRAGLRPGLDDVLALADDEPGVGAPAPSRYAQLTFACLDERLP